MPSSPARTLEALLQLLYGCASVHVLDAVAGSVHLLTLITARTVSDLVLEGAQPARAGPRQDP